MGTEPRKIMLRQPAVEKAGTYLESLVSHARTESRQLRLAGIHELARAAGVSYVSMRKAVVLMKERGVLSVKQRQGIIIQPHRPALVERRDRFSDKWQRIAAHLRQDLLAGANHPDDRLPSVKELCATYGADYRTMRKAVTSLVNLGLLIPDRTSFRIRHPKLSGLSSSLLVVAGAQVLSKMYLGYYSSRYLPFISSLERECAHRNLSLVRETYESVNSDDRRRDDVRGCVLWIDNADGEKARLLIQRLRGWEKPIVAIDAEGNFLDHHQETLPALAAVFRIGDTAAGYECGRFLIRSGHSAIGYFTHHRYRGAWAHRRQAGVLAAFDEAGFGRDHARIFDSASLASPPASRDRRGRAPRSDSVDPGRIEAAIDTIRRAARGHFPAPDLLHGLLEESDYFEDMRRTMRPLFKAALEDKRITAWVTEGDTLAVHAALPFLRSAGVRVPRDLSVMGIESTLLAQYRSLTVFDFAFGAVPARMLNLILSWGQQRRKRFPDAGIFDIAGPVIARGTTSLVRKIVTRLPDSESETTE